MAPVLNRSLRFRMWLAHRLARLARRIHPECPEVMAFWQDRMVDFVLTGQSTIKVETVPFPFKDEIAPIRDGGHK